MSDALEFGISLRLLHGAKEESRRAESLGYDYLLTGEHIAFHGPTANNMVSLAAAAGATERIKLLSGIVLAPLYPPALWAVNSPRSSTPWACRWRSGGRGPTRRWR